MVVKLLKVDNPKHCLFELHGIETYEMDRSTSKFGGYNWANFQLGHKSSKFRPLKASKYYLHFHSSFKTY